MVNEEGVITEAVLVCHVVLDASVLLLHFISAPAKQRQHQQPSFEDGIRLLHCACYGWRSFQQRWPEHWPAIADLSRRLPVLGRHGQHQPRPHSLASAQGRASHACLDWVWRMGSCAYRFRFAFTIWNTSVLPCSFRRASTLALKPPRLADSMRGTV